MRYSLRREITATTQKANFVKVCNDIAINVLKLSLYWRTLLLIVIICQKLAQLFLTNFKLWAVTFKISCREVSHNKGVLKNLATSTTVPESKTFRNFQFSLNSVNIFLQTQENKNASVAANPSLGFEKLHCILCVARKKFAVKYFAVCQKEIKSIKNVAIKTANHPKPSETTRNYLQPPTVFQVSMVLLIDYSMLEILTA